MRSVLPEMVPKVAVMVVEPWATALTTPAEPAELLTVAAALFDDAQVTEEVMSCLVIIQINPGSNKMHSGVHGNSWRARRNLYADQRPRSQL